MPGKGAWASIIQSDNTTQAQSLTSTGAKSQGLKNEDLIDQLAESKEEIEGAFGETLEWQRLEGARACRIKKQIDLGGYRDESQWRQVQDDIIVRHDSSRKGSETPPKGPKV